MIRCLPSLLEKRAFHRRRFSQGPPNVRVSSDQCSMPASRSGDFRPSSFFRLFAFIRALTNQFMHTYTGAHFYPCVVNTNNNNNNKKLNYEKLVKVVVASVLCPSSPRSALFGALTFIISFYDCHFICLKLKSIKGEQLKCVCDAVCAWVYSKSFFVPIFVFLYFFIIFWLFGSWEILTRMRDHWSVYRDRKIMVIFIIFYHLIFFFNRKPTCKQCLLNISLKTAEQIQLKQLFSAP